jgi:hypothetical protein
MSGAHSDHHDGCGGQAGTGGPLAGATTIVVTTSGHLRPREFGVLMLKNTSVTLRLHAQKAVANHAGKFQGPLMKFTAVWRKRLSINEIKISVSMIYLRLMHPSGMDVELTIVVEQKRANACAIRQRSA